MFFKVEFFNKFFYLIYLIDLVDVNNLIIDVVNLNLLLNVIIIVFEV